ncbi:beta-1,6-N-acetylglucosaminyltransferase [Synechococcus sp. M16CYN]|uniref:beta-1,6-N-acetylglucosaminyltransferase n=1 Tax=Synechococcus sp. M16CYN TaxID=3103139 RepID=UPI0030E3FD35
MKTGFCFLVKESLNNCSLWEQFLHSAMPNSFGLYVHAKTSSPRPVLSESCIDLEPLDTAWGDRSLVAATQRLLSIAVDDGCDSMVLVSGDMLPLQPFDWIQSFCKQTRFSLQQKVGLDQQQTIANAMRFARIAPYFGLPINQLKKQNMFFIMTRNDFCRICENASIMSFPLLELADEYYWVNHAIRIGAEWKSSNVVFCNPDPTRTQALNMELTPKLLHFCRSVDYGFIRKVAGIDAQAVADLINVYAL